MTVNKHTAPIMRISRHRLSIDGRGVTTLVGLHGCPLDCHYCLNNKCHTPDGIWQHMTAQELYNKVCIDDIYFRSTGGGITFGGGEPALHSAFIEEFARLNTLKWNITLETSLNIPLHNLELLSHVVDDYIIDIKSLNPNIYRLYTGKDINVVLSNLQYLIDINKGAHIIVRTPLIPGYNTEQDVKESTAKLRKMGIEHFDAFTYRTSIAHNKFLDGKSGKSICNVLKKIRSIIAEANNIPYTPASCSHDTCTSGNCPMCESELAWLTKEIQSQQKAIL
ncbi:MAG: radical SAM protein [Bacteroidaceae bacterium]|nr:radical SAM protein [Bacteroidaceae bacterium]